MARVTTGILRSVLAYLDTQIEEYTEQMGHFEGEYNASVEGTPESEQLYLRYVQAAAGLNAYIDARRVLSLALDALTEKEESCEATSSPSP